MKALGKILVPVDFEAPSQKAVRVAVDLAARLSSSLTLVHVYDSRGYALMTGYVAYTRDERAALRRACARRLEAARGDLEAMGVRNVETRLLEGLPAPRIVELASSGAFDLIVMATHRKASPWQKAIGMVAEDVIGEAACPVIMVNDEPPIPRDVVSIAAQRRDRLHAH